MVARHIDADTGFSREAKDVFEIARAVDRHMSLSVSLFGERDELLEQIAALVDECSTPDWDAYGAEPIDPAAADRAAALVRALPPGYRLPECAPLPDGCISLDWIESRLRSVSVSVGTGPRLAYAWLDGTDHGHGVATFEFASLPASVLDTVQRVCGPEWRS